MISAKIVVLLGFGSYLLGCVVGYLRAALVMTARADLCRTCAEGRALGEAEKVREIVEWMRVADAIERLEWK